MNNTFAFGFALLASLAYGQSADQDKGRNAIIGTWTFESGAIKGDQLGEIKLDHWPIDTVRFYSNMNFELLIHNKGEGTARQSGHWDISEKGKVLILTNRKATPPSAESLKDARLPLRIRSRQLTITYSLTFGLSKGENRSIPSPDGPGAAQISYVRLK